MSRSARHFEWHGLRSRAAPDLAADPYRRMTGLLVLFTLLALAVFVRAAWLHYAMGAQLRASALAPRTARSEIPAERGAIVARDGTVLAEDRQVDVLAIHYRYLQKPTEPAWLATEARRRLQSWQAAEEESRRPEPPEMQRNIQLEIEQLHQRLAIASGLSATQWQLRCGQIQQRVARAAAAVNRRRQSAYQQSLATVSTSGRDSPGESWPLLVQDAIKALFSPPDPLPPPPMTIREETQHHVVLYNVPAELKKQIQASPQDFPGVRIDQVVQRTYPHGRVAANIIGHLGRHDEDQFVGRAGAELQYEARLAGVPGLSIETLNRHGDIVATREERRPTAGRNLVLAVDASLQRTAEGLLDDACRLREFRQRGDRDPQHSPPPAGGSIVVMDVMTGDLLVSATAPRFDPGAFARSDTAAVTRWLNDTNRAMLDRSIQMAIPPGSVFKPLTAVALLEADELDPEAPLICRGYLHSPDRQRCQLFRNYGVGHGPTNLWGRAAQSCNVYFFHHATRLGHRPLISWATRFGFGQATGVGLSSEATGNLPTPRSLQDRAWQDEDTQSLAIGQGRLTATPLQIARMMAAVGNGGHLVTPNIIRQSIQADGASPPADQPHGLAIPGLHAKTLKAVRTGLIRAVSDPAGTAHDTLMFDNVSVAAKTGTAQTGGGQQDHAWVAGFAPADRPRFAFVVVMEYAGSGGRRAAPLARRMLEQMAQLGYVGP